MTQLEPICDQQIGSFFIVQNEIWYLSISFIIICNYASTLSPNTDAANHHRTACAN